MRTFVLLFSIILFPAFSFSAPSVFSDYEVASNLSHQGTCDAGQTEVKVYQNQTYFLRVVMPKNNNIYYVLSKDLGDPYHYFVKNAEAIPAELSRSEWLERLMAESPNYAQRAIDQKHDCAIQELKN